jgi:hypothetical protein
VYRQRFLDALRFHDDFFLHNQIDPIATVQLEAFVFDGQFHLAPEGDPTQKEFVA